MQWRVPAIALLLLAAVSGAQENLRPNRPVAFVGGMLLDGYEAEPIHHPVVVFDNGRIVAAGGRFDELGTV